MKLPSHIHIGRRDPRPAPPPESLRSASHPVHSRHHGAGAPLGVRIANAVTGGMGSWRFIVIQSVLVTIWIVLNVVGWISHWDVYPFVLLNLLFSVQAAYASPLILMAGNVAAARDRDLWEHDYQVNQDAYAKLASIELQTQALLRAVLPPTEGGAADGNPQEDQA